MSKVKDSWKILGISQPNRNFNFIRLIPKNICTNKQYFIHYDWFLLQNPQNDFPQSPSHAFSSLWYLLMKKIVSVIDLCFFFHAISLVFGFSMITTQSLNLIKTLQRCNLSSENMTIRSIIEVFSVMQSCLCGCLQQSISDTNQQGN